VQDGLEQVVYAAVERDEALLELAGNQIVDILGKFACYYLQLLVIALHNQQLAPYGYYRSPAGAIRPFVREQPVFKLDDPVLKLSQLVKIVRRKEQEEFQKLIEGVEGVVNLIDQPEAARIVGQENQIRLSAVNANLVVPVLLVSHVSKHKHDQIRKLVRGRAYMPAGAEPAVEFLAYVRLQLVNFVKPQNFSHQIQPAFENGRGAQAAPLTRQ
jgi:hypothetical protein